MIKERIKILDNFIDCLSHEDLRYVMNVAIPCRFRFEAKIKDNETLRKAFEVIASPNSSERDVLCAYWDINKVLKK